MSADDETGWRRQLYITVETMGQDIEELGDRARRWLARTLRSIAPAIVHLGAQIGGELRSMARRIDGMLLQEGKPPSRP